jgi:chemotaxis response regulator CheB
MSLQTRTTGVPKFAPADDFTPFCEAVRAQGGRVLVQEESTCTVYGMPRAVAEAGLADAVHGLDEMPAAIAREAGL